MGELSISKSTCVNRRYGDALTYSENYEGSYEDDSQGMKMINNGGNKARNNNINTK